MSADVSVPVTVFGRDGPPLILLHGLAGSSREMLPTARVLGDAFRVLLMDQRGHGSATRRPADLSREAFIDDVVHVLEQLAPGKRCILVGQPMGAHTAFLTAAARPDLVERLVMLEGHVAGSDDTGEAVGLGEFFASWPVPFADEDEARTFLGSGASVDAWIADLEVTHGGLRPRFDADVMQHTIEAVHKPAGRSWRLCGFRRSQSSRRTGCSATPKRTSWSGVVRGLNASTCRRGATMRILTPSESGSVPCAAGCCPTRRL